ncbi:hypothetical protein BZA05DRAFT_472336 [Tricharina praecox]|uniref:uncharacterized protein n=1 Tax=Tricharina praecox TaxID=43433 RepID=UPI00221E7773|nr:uncharacterized protein BZA05DRAFT_472336 [Tricharina praecox]KAI5855474.1 hypothetical protein BZA05DRAFT_472336 [Tricharina praecox]
MSRISSLGLHTPTALQYCITEKILADPPEPDSYTWTAGLPHEEILVTKRAVIWSQGGVIRRVFQYGVEKELVVQAVITWFPSDDPLDAVGAGANANGDDDADGEGYVSGGGSEGNKRKPDWSDDIKAKKRLSTWNSKTRSYATQLGNFPKAHQANGGPRGPETVSEDPEHKQVQLGRARALVVFLKTQAFVYFLSGTMHIIHLPFEIQHAMPAPHGLILQRKHERPPMPMPFATGNSFTKRPPAPIKDLPSLFTLTDPLSEPGLVMSTASTPCSEGLLYISPSSEFDTADSSTNLSGPEVIFAVTYNHERSAITVWQVRYVPQDKPVHPQRRTPSTSGTMTARRRSSFGPGTGATTPVASASSTTLGGTGKSGRESLATSEVSSLNVLGEDFETVGGRRASRRVSSMMARADLSVNQDPGHRFSDVSTSIGTSFGAPPVPQNTMILDDQPVDELLNELNMGSLGIGMDDLGNYDGEGLKQEVVMHKLESFPSKLPEEKNQPGLDPSSRVFTLRDPAAVGAATFTGKEVPGKKVVLFMMNKNEGSLLQITFNIQIHSTGPKGYARRSSTRFTATAMGYTAVMTDMQKREDVRDAIRVQHCGVQRVLILTDEGKFILYSPWSGAMDITLPPTLARWNPNVVGEDGSRRGSRKKEWARMLSTTPDTYRRLEYADLDGRLTVVDGDGVSHRISITLAPRGIATKSCLETLRILLGGSLGPRVGEGILSAWMAVARWLQISSDPEAGLSQDVKGLLPPDEWKAFVVTLFLLGVPLLPEPKPQPRRKSGFARSSSIVAERDWEDLACHEGEWGSAPEYLRGSAWHWMVEEQDTKALKQTQQPSSKSRGGFGAASEGRLTNKFITDCIHQARQFRKSKGGDIDAEIFGGANNLPEVRRTGLAVALVSLHLLREEWKLDIAMEGAGRRLCPVLRQIATWLGWSWADNYMLEDVEMVGWAYDESRITMIEVPQEPFRPPDIYEWVMACLKGESPAPFTVLQDIVAPSGSIPSNSQGSQRSRNPFSPPPAPPPPTVQKPVFAKIMPRTHMSTALYTTIATPGATDVDVIEKMVALGFTLASLQRLPEGIGIPLREAIARCQEQPPTTWGVEALDLVGRKDLRMLIEPGKRRRTETKWQSIPTHEAVRDVHTICNSALDLETIGSYDPMAEQDRQHIARLLFKEDRRIYEAAKLLQTNRPSYAKCIPEHHWSEQDTLENYKDVAARVAMRTLAVPAGRGLFNFSARVPLLTERFPIPGFNLSCVVKPSNQTVSADKGLFTEEKVCWAFFHSGVASGVSISREAKEIDTSWIVFNKPPELTNRHAGFLLGLGLNGHLRNIAKWHAYNYLTPKHTMVSIGLLLGISASFLGTMDATITRLLSVHVTRLLPPGSADLNITPLTQTAGIMGVGLLYANTQHRRMTEVMLSEIEHVEIYDSCVPTDNLRDEGYRLAAGFALGLINLGCGTDLRGLHDMQLVERLLAVAVGPKKVSLVHVIDKACAGAIIALALVYLKTGDESVAAKLDVPEMPHLLEYVRPDLFLIRTLAKHLIMWKKIEGTFAWIENNLRPFHRKNFKLGSIRHLDSEDLAFYNILAGLCFAIGLKYAGSGDTNVRDVLIHYLDQFIRLCSLPAQNHDQKLTRTTVRNCQDLLGLSVATVMAGTGDIVTFRRFRKLHGRTEADVPYGSHLAAHTAIGVLFLGSGSFTFGTSNIAIAALVCAFYPLFPSAPLDNKCHLQAFRHFWVLAVEHRCIIPRDVDTFHPTKIPITITLKDGAELQRIAPCMLPELSLISNISTTSPEHWTVILDFENSAAHRAGFERSQSIFVHRRSAHASQSTVFQAALQALEDVENHKAPMEWVGRLNAFAGLDRAEKALFIREGAHGGGESVDERLELEYALKSANNRCRLMGVAVVTARKEGQGGLWISDETVENLRAGVWMKGA